MPDVHGLGRVDQDNLELWNGPLEQSLLGCLLCAPKLLDEIPSTFKSAMFGWNEHGLIYDAIVAASHHATTIAINVIQTLRGEEGCDQAYIARFDCRIRSPRCRARLKGCAEAITDLAQRRRLVELARKIEREALKGVWGRTRCRRSGARATIAIDEVLGMVEQSSTIVTLDKACPHSAGRGGRGS